MIEITKLVKTLHGGGHAVEILKSLDLTIPTGQLLAITGESGSGKTTLLSLIAGLDTPTSGQIVIDGQDIMNSLSCAEKGSASSSRTSTSSPL